MLKYKNLTILGTSHIATQSIREVESIIKNSKIEIVALELDPLRASSLTKKKTKLRIRMIREMGVKAFLLNLVGAYIEKKLGKIVKVSPGSEMKKAIELSKKNKIKIFLIDQDIRITLKRLASSITKKEVFNFIIDLFKSFSQKPKFKIDLTKVPSKIIIKKMTIELKKRYPNVYKTLFKERNAIMTKNLKAIMSKYPKEEILAIVGAGHEEAIIKELK